MGEKIEKTVDTKKNTKETKKNVSATANTDTEGEGEGEEIIEIDNSLFIENINGPTRFAVQLIQYLQEQNLLKIWISCNRPCFALVSILKVPSARKIALTALKMYKKEIEISAKLHTGGKILLEEINM